MAIDPNVILQGYVPSVPTAEQMKESSLKDQSLATSNQVADQTLAQQKIATQESQRALKVRDFIADSMRKHTTIPGEGDQPSQQSAAPQPSQPSTQSPVPSATLGTDAAGNQIPKIGTESPSGDPQPDSMQPSNTLAQAATLPGVETAGPTPTPYQEPGTAVTQTNSLQASAAPVGAASSPTGAASATTGTTAGVPAVASTSRRPVTDWEAVSRDMADAGYGPEALKLDADRRAQLKGALDLQEKQLENEGKRQAILGQNAGAIPWVQDFSNPIQVNAAAAASLTAIKRSVGQGVLDPQHGAALGQTIQEHGYTPEIQQELQYFAHAAQTSSEQHAAHLADLKEQRDALEGKTTLAQKQAEAERIGRQNAGVRMSQATTAQQWAQQYNALPENMKPYFDDPAHFNPETSPQKAMLAGMSEQGMGNFMNQQSRIEASKDQRDMMNQFRGEQLSIERMNAADRQANRQTQGKTDLRQTRDELFKLQNQERNLYDVRTDLQSSISSNGKTYVDKSGRTMPMSTATKQTGESDQALLQQMKDRYNQVTNDAVSVIGQKNDLIRGTGATPQVSRETAAEKLTTGDPFWKKVNNQTGTGTTPATPPAVPVPPAPKPVATPPAAARPAQAPNSQDWIKKIPNYGKSFTDATSQKTMVVGKTYYSPSGPVVFLGFAGGKAQVRPLNQ